MPFQIQYILLPAAVLLVFPAICSAQAVLLDAAVLQQMQETVHLQQKQLEQQTKQIRQQSRKLEALKQQVTSLLQSVPSSKPPAVHLPPPVTSAAVSQAVTSGNDRIKLEVSGQINRAVNSVNDGGPTRLGYTAFGVDYTNSGNMPTTDNRGYCSRGSSGTVFREVRYGAVPSATVLFTEAKQWCSS